MNSTNEKKLRSVLKKFNRKVFFDEILPTLSAWVSREELTSEIRRLKSKINDSSVVDTYVDLLKHTEISAEEIEEKLNIFMLQAVAYNPTRKNWTTYTLQGEIVKGKFEKHLRADIKHFFLEHKVHAAVTVKSVDSIQWVQVIKKKIIKHRLKLSMPIYVAHFFGEPYLFLNQKETSHDILQSLTEAFGYTSYKFSNLNGNDLDSLLKHLNQKGVKRGISAPFRPADNIQETSNGKDYAQHAGRRKFISDLMGPSPPKLSNYAVLAKNLPWKAKINRPLMRQKVFDMKIEFKTGDTVEMLKDMAECGVLKVPPPSYVVNLMSTGRNNIKMRVQGMNGATDTETQTDAGF